VAVSGDGGTIAAGNADGLLKTWRLEPGPRPPLAVTVGSLAESEAKGNLARVQAISIGAGGRLAAAAGAAGTTIWSLREMPEPDQPPRPLARIEGRSRAVAYEVDLLVTGRKNSFAIYGTGGACRGRGEEPCLLGEPARPYSEEMVESLAARKYGSRVLLVSTAVRGDKGFFNLWDMTDVEETGEIAHLSSSDPLDTEIRELSFSPRAPLVAAGADDGKTRVWDISDPRDPDGIDIQRARGNENQPVTAIAFSRDGSWLASGGQDQQVVLWRVRRGDSGRLTVEGTPETLAQSQTIFALAFSPDEKTLAVGDGDGATCLYELSTRQSIGSPYCLLGPHSESSGGVDTIKFAHLEGQEPMLLTAGTGQPIVAWDSLLWSLDKDSGTEAEIADYLCALARRKLTPDEWNSVFVSTDLADDYHQTCERPSK
jgi:WD40 repeat protein